MKKEYMTPQMVAMEMKTVGGCRPRGGDGGATPSPPLWRCWGFFQYGITKKKNKKMSPTLIQLVLLRGEF